MKRATTLLVPAAVLAACAAPAPVAMPVGAAPVQAVLKPVAGGGVRVTRTGPVPFAYDQGADARRAADALCGPGGVQSSIHDRFDGGGWVFVEGCA
ncbi:hypothetical protein RNZ50_14235 [Paracoccaceae bacterium Fryx2]|nr:hypothetical protein [Paracoccaceae bacterium Fryx2]